MSKELFLKIANKEIPSAGVYEDDDFYAFLDIRPTNPGHTLVIPKKPYKNIYEVPDDTLGSLMKVVKKVAIAVKQATNAEGINIVNNNDSAAGQIIFHYHIHIIPRFANDGLRHWPHREYGEEEMKNIQKKIKSAIDDKKKQK